MDGVIVGFRFLVTPIEMGLRTMAPKTKLVNNQYKCRLDRTFLYKKSRSPLSKKTRLENEAASTKLLEIQSIERIGMKTLAFCDTIKKVEVWHSDHFGLVSCFKTKHDIP
jgi:hypothetical protein